MRWVPVLILIYVLLGIQSGAEPFWTVRGCKPDLGLIAVVFVALNARAQATLAIAMGVGLIQDLLSVHPLGLFALGYVLAAYFLLGLREVVYREHPLTHLSFAFLGELLVIGILMVQGWMHGPVPAARQMLLSAAYTALAGVIILYPLQKSRGIFFQRG
ncbi:MAG TPA: rod shape-determining protein MreD [Tepidisphaeraceae bacterium]|jgi:rod shape-determining protein MreD